MWTTRNVPSINLDAVWPKDLLIRVRSRFSGKARSAESLQKDYHWPRLSTFYKIMIRLATARSASESRPWPNRVPFARSLQYFCSLLQYQCYSWEKSLALQLLFYFSAISKMNSRQQSLRVAEMSSLNLPGSVIRPCAIKSQIRMPSRLLMHPDSTGALSTDNPIEIGSLFIDTC